MKYKMHPKMKAKMKAKIGDYKKRKAKPLSLKRVVKPRRPTTHDRGQHELICAALKTSADPNAPGNTAYESVCELLMNIDEALAAKTLSAAKGALKTKIGSRNWIQLYGTGEA